MKQLLLLPLSLLASACVYWTPMSHRPTANATVIENVPMQHWDIKSCGAGALSTVLQHHGDATTMKEWEATLPKTRGGVMSIDLVLAARQKGFEAQLVTGDRGMIEAELREGRPVILMLQVIQAPGKSYDFFHYIVIDGYDPTHNVFRTQFGDGKARWATLDRIEPAWKPTKHAAIVIRPGDPLAGALRAAVQLEESGKLALAAQSYREILAKNPNSVVAWTNLGNAEMRLGRRPAAEEAFRKALALQPESADTLNNLAWLLYEEKRIEEAEPLARKAATTAAPDPWMRLDTLARILAARGECDEAKMTFRQAIEAVPAARSADRAAIEEAASNIGACSPAAPTGQPPSMR
ncbi:MAG TPA: tetratricopeptide repeat protein [Thermoanaerobaculia bacterium]